MLRCSEVAMDDISFKLGKDVTILSPNSSRDQ